MMFVVLASCTSSSRDERVTAKPWGNSSKPRRSQSYTITSKGGYYKVGKPYVIFGTTYYPKEDYSYSQKGVASWYGKDFHAKSTANGEKYNMNSLTAAHRTLPLPSIVKVTNLENGRTVILRVNDRGPYAKDRIIDISKRGAEILGFQTKGTAKVKVEVMAKESKALKEAMLGKNAKGSAYIPPAPDESVEKVAYSAGDILSAKVPNSKTTSSAKNIDIKTSSNGKYVQVGSFASYSSAANLKSQLTESFSNVAIYSTSVDGSTFYRVRLGPYGSEQVARDNLDKVVGFGIYNAKIITE